MEMLVLKGLSSIRRHLDPVRKIYIMLGRCVQRLEDGEEKRRSEDELHACHLDCSDCARVGSDLYFTQNLGHYVHTCEKNSGTTCVDLVTCIA